MKAPRFLQDSSRRKLFYLAVLLLVLSVVVRIAVTTVYIQQYDRNESVSRSIDGNQQSYHAIIKADARKYYFDANKITEQVRAGENFFVAGERYYGPFLYPRLIALYGLLTGKVHLNADGTVPTGQIYWFFVIQSLVFGAALVAFFLALTTIVSSRIAAMAAAFLAMEPILVQFSAQMLTETLFIAFMLLAISVFIFTLRVKPEGSLRRSWPPFALLGMLLGLMYLQRPGAIGLVAVFLIAIFVHYTWRRRIPFLKASLLVISPLILTFGLIGLHNYARAGFFAVDNPQGNNTFYNYFGSQVMSEVTGLDFATARAQLAEEGLLEAQRTGIVPADARELTEQESAKLSPFLRGRAIEIALDHPWTTLRVVTYRTLLGTHLDPLATYRRYDRIYKPEDPDLQAAQAAHFSSGWTLKIGYSALILPLSAFGWAFARRSIPLPVNVLFTLAIIYFALVSGALVATSDPRYTIPNLVFYSIYWTFGITLLARLWSTKGKVALRPRHVASQGIS